MKHILPQHPEAKEGEVCISNATLEDFYNHFGHATKRMGRVAYTRYGQPINEMYPVFVQASEYYGDTDDTEQKTD